MDLHTAVSLIQHPSILHTTPQYWADLGAGAGTFTRALSTLLPPHSQVTAVDRDHQVLDKVAVKETIALRTQKADFVREDLALYNLDGILMANALHFVKDKDIILAKVKQSLRAGGILLLVEYDTDRSNLWVPYPMKVQEYRRLTLRAGLSGFEVINKVPSRFRNADIAGMICFLP